MVLDVGIVATRYESIFLQLILSLGRATVLRYQREECMYQSSVRIHGGDHFCDK
jgi:hypothetical protein